MTVIISFPTRVTDQNFNGPEMSDNVLHELLRKAVVAHRAGAARVSGSLGHRHHLAVSLAVLDAIEIVMGACGIAKELEHCLEIGITNIKQLARIARDFDGPQSA
jgi:hypothetical protein